MLSAAPSRPAIDQPGHNARLISWSEDSSTDTYELWINNLTTGQAGYLQASDLTVPSYSLSRRPMEGKYRIWVRAMNEHGRSPWSTPVDLVLSSHTSAPNATSLLSPQSAEAGEPVTFTWQAASRATRYELWVRNLTTGEAAVIHQTSLTGDSFTSTDALPTGRYRAWLRAHNGVGASQWSEPLVFRVVDVTSPPARPVFRAPGRPGQVEWKPVPFADSYEVWANNLTTGESRALYSAAHDSNVYSRGRRIDPGRYRIWVRARNEAGYSSWSAPYDYIFATQADQAPNAPGTLTAKVSDTDGKVTLQWEDGHVDGRNDFADYYEVWVSNSARQRVWYRKSLQTLSLTSDTPLPNGGYHLWVRASNAYGRSRWSSAYSFTVNLPAAAPQATAVQSISFGDQNELQVTWNVVEHSARYEVQIQDEAGQSEWTYVVSGEHSSLILYPSRRPHPSTDYVLRVRATNVAGSSDWSEIRRFTSAFKYFGVRTGNSGRG